VVSTALRSGVTKTIPTIQHCGKLVGVVVMLIVGAAGSARLRYLGLSLVGGLLRPVKVLSVYRSPGAKEDDRHTYHVGDGRFEWLHGRRRSAASSSYHRP
jgi:hypothetical protein